MSAAIRNAAADRLRRDGRGGLDGIIFRDHLNARVAPNPAAPVRPRRPLGLRPVDDSYPSALAGVSAETLDAPPSIRDVLESFDTTVGIHLDGDRELRDELRSVIAEMKASHVELKAEVSALGLAVERLKKRPARAAKAKS
jgi:hypothetical protein